MIDCEKLKILTEGAKYDVSCSSSGSGRRNYKGGTGDAHPSGICHSFTPDGRCISLLKILLSNDCIYNCRYCPNRSSADVKRATATAEEICELVINFYRRNYIEGLFLSSAVFKNPDYTMEQLVEAVKLLRVKYKFNGYIHLKGIPRADDRLISEGGRWADRMSYNIEFPSEKSLKLLAPQKSGDSLIKPMQFIATKKLSISENKQRDRFLPAGQTTQMIVGATPETDGRILKLTQYLYRKYSMKRVYFSSYVPIVKDSVLPDKCTGLLREHRLYQADWLLRFYGFSAEEIVDEGGNLSEECDPKFAWAMRHIELFPVEVNSASFEELLRVPGIGVKSVNRIISARRYTKLTFKDLVRMKVVTKRARHFITCGGKFFGEEPEKVKLLPEKRVVTEQMSIFSNEETALSALTGEL